MANQKLVGDAGLAPEEFVDKMFAGLGANRFLRFIPGAHLFLKTAHDWVHANESKLGLKAGFTWQQAVDAVFAALELAFPAEAFLLKILQAMADGLFTKSPVAPDAPGIQVP